MKNIFLALTLLVAPSLSSATPVSGNTVLPDGTVVKQELPGAPQGNPTSDKADNTKKAYICHATSAVDTNGYLILHIGDPAIEAHLSHEHSTPNGQGQEKEARDRVGTDVTMICGGVIRE